MGNKKNTPKEVKPSVELEEMIESNKVLTANNEQLEKDLAEAQSTIDGYKSELDKVNGELIKSEEELSHANARVEHLEKVSSIKKSNSVIMDAKDLDKNKIYVTGPSGLGFVEA